MISIPETEALKKWCPFARSACDDGEFSANRFVDGSPDSGARCITHKCMAWLPTGGKEERGICALMSK